MKIDDLLEKPYWIIDILPKQVPSNSPGQYFEIEEYFLDKKRFKEIKYKHINLILKLNCYKDIRIYEQDIINPKPEHIEKEMLNKELYIMVEDAAILSQTDNLYMTIYNPNKELLELIKQLAISEGLYVFKP